MYRLLKINLIKAEWIEKELILEYMSVKRRKELEPAKVREMAAQLGLTEEETVFSLMKRHPALFGAMNDWDDIRNITIAVIRELKGCVSYREIYEMILRVVDLYDTQVISVLRVFSDVKRLAYFVNEMIESMLEMPDYRDKLTAQYGLTTADKLALRGIVLERITNQGVRDVFMKDRCRYFSAEVICARRCTDHFAGAAA